MHNNHSPDGRNEVLETGTQPRSSASATTGAVLVKPAGDASEAELIQRVLGGNTETFYELVRPHERAVFIVARSILRNDADAEEAAQEAILKAFTNLAQFRGHSKFSTWLIRITINQALVTLRREGSKIPDSLHHWSRDEKDDYVPLDFADWREIPSETLQRNEVRLALSRALASLLPKYRSVFVLRDVQQFTTTETAKLLGLKESLVKTRLLRARLQMRDALAPGMGGSWTAGHRASIQATS